MPTTVQVLPLKVGPVSISDKPKLQANSRRLINSCSIEKASVVSGMDKGPHSYSIVLPSVFSQNVGF